MPTYHFIKAKLGVLEKPIFTKQGWESLTQSEKNNISFSNNTEKQLLFSSIFGLTTTICVSKAAKHFSKPLSQ
ncbi:MAG: hypothetical protein MZV70_01675 [Desulfobacterales bacterium]|nr:hypothetical protein [Desulfobacterales bacterium]